MTDDGVVAELRDELERLRLRMNDLEETLARESEVGAVLADLSRKLLSAASIEDISYEILEHAKRLTGSRFGYAGFIDPHTGHLVSPTMTGDIGEAGQAENKSVLFTESSGLWEWALENRTSVMTNDPTGDPGSSGMPEGRLPIRRFLCVPAMSGDILVGQIVLADADRDYTDRDVARAELLADYYALAIQRERAEEALRQSEEKYRLIYDFTGEAIYTYDTGFILIGVNKKACEFIGYSDEELLGRNILELGILHPDDYERTLQDIQRLFQGEVVNDELRFIRRDGGVAIGDVTGAPLYSREGEIIAFTNVARDITERKQAEKKLNDQLNFIQDLIETIPSPIYYKDRSGRYLGCNKAFEEYAGFDRDEIIGKAVLEVAPADLAAVYQQMDNALLSEPGAQVYEGLHRHTDGTLRNVVFNKAVFYDAEGSVAGIVGVILDITERKRAVEVLQRINEELDAYAYVVSHDLRGPIAVITTAAAALQEQADKVGGDKAGQIQQLAGLISKNADGARELAENLLSLARVGQTPIKTSPVDVSEVVEQVLRERAAPIAEKGVKVKTDDYLGRIIADPTHIYQLFSNLIGNAVNYIDNPLSEVTINYRVEEDGWHHYWVRDNGPGIPPGDVERIFRPMFKGKTGGTGIGLAIVKKIVEVYGGGIEAYNDGGACFEFFLSDARERD